MGYFKTSDGLTLVYDDQGEGPVTLCLSGLTRCARDFEYVLPHLTGRVVRLDYRGRGRSDWASPATYTVPTEARDVIELLNHLALDKVSILGTSRGGLIAMLLAATAKDRLAGVCLNDIGPEIADAGMAAIRGYIGVPPEAQTHAEAAADLAMRLPGFVGVPSSRWAEEACHFFDETADGLSLRYDPDLKIPVIESASGPAPDLWPFFDALDGLPLALIRGENSNILSQATAAEMRHRRPDMIYGNIPDRGHVPFLDEPAALDVLAEWQKALT